MHTYLITLDRQAYYDKPIDRWGPDKSFHFLVDGETLQDAIDIGVKQCRAFNAQLPESHRFVAGPIYEDPKPDHVDRLKPAHLADPYPDMVLPHLPHIMFYVDVDDESRFHPGDKTGSGLPVILLLSKYNGEAAYTSAVDGRLYMTSGADKKHTVKKERIDMITGAFPPSPVMWAFDESGNIDWENTVPDLSRLNLSRLWLEGQAKLE